MNISAPFILRPVMTTLLTIATLFIGIYAFRVMPVSNLPDINYPTITVTVPFPGANPDIMANTVATPLEKEFMTIPGVKYVTSTNTLGQTNIVLVFDIKKDIDLASVDVDAAIVRARPRLPANLPQQPSFRKVNPSSSPILYISITSETLTQGELYDYANTLIGQRLSIIDGVAQVTVYGSQKAVRVQLDPGLVASKNLTFDDIARALDRSNQYEPLGQFDGGYFAMPIYDNAAAVDASEYRPLIVSFKNQAPVRLDSLGDVVDSLQKDRSVRRFIKGKLDQPSVTLAIQVQPGANIVKVADAINSTLPALEAQLPASLETFIVFDRSISIRASIEDVEFTLILAFILVVTVIFLYLGQVRETIIPSIAMPVSIFATFAVIYPIGYTIDNLSLLALTLAIGFIIDDAIVVLENIVRHMERGEEPITASLNGSREIGFTIVSMTLSLIAVFIPLIFMAGLIGKLFQEFSITLTIVTLMSGLVSLTLTPMLCSRFLKSRKEEKGRLEIFSRQLNSRMLGYYRTGLEWVLNHRKTTLFVGFLSVVVSAILFKILPTDFIPNEDIGFLQIYTEAEQGTSSDEMARLQNLVVDAIKDEPTIATLLSISSQSVYRQGIIFVGLIPINQRKEITEIAKDFSAKIKNIPGINAYIKPLPLIDLNIGTQVRGNFQYLLQSLDSDVLYASADALYQKMREDPMFTGVSTDLEIKTPQIDLLLQRDQASTLGIDAQTFETPLFLGFSGNRVSRIETPIDQYDVILELKRDLQRNPSSLQDMYVRSSVSNQLVPLTAATDVKEKVGPASVNHFAQFPSVTITFNIADGVPLSEGLERLRELAAQTLSPKVTGDVTGAAQTFEESIASIGYLLVITIFTIYIVLGILYESFIHPVTILSTLPPAIAGGLLTLYIFDMPLSLYAYLGIILLIGIVKKNGIMIVDFALDNIREKGEDAYKSIFEASMVRFRPIMMTTFAAIMGAVPIALGVGAGAALRRPLGYVIIGGMLVSQLITLFVTPVIYLYFEEFSEYLKARRKRY